MASGITPKIYSSAGAYWLWAEWSSIINVENNTSTVTVISYVGSNSYGYYSSSYNTGFVTINGIVSSYASNPALAASTTKQEVHRSTQIITHNADGTKSIDISVNHKHSTTFNLTSSATIALDTIPRSSVPTLSVGSQAIGSAITIYTNRASAGFTHYIYAVFGGLSIEIGSGVGTSIVWTLPASLAAQIPNSLSGVGSIWVDTYSGSTYIGSKNIGFWATVPDIAAYQPSLSGLTAAISGTGRDKTIAKYVQAISKVVLSFTAAANGGATLSSSSINIKRQSDQGNSMDISGTSGTSGVFTLSGVYIITATTTDSRGRSKSVTLTITVEAYAVPKITSFTAARKATPNTASVDTVKNGTYTYMAGNNPLSVVVARAPRGGAFLPLETTAGTTLGAFSGTYVSTGNTDTASWEFRLTITDSFGNSAVATLMVSTASVALSIKGDIGIGVGKVWERGALDLAGDMYVDGVLQAFPAAPASHIHTEYAKAYIVANGYQGVTLNDGSTANWIRTTTNGLLPNASGQASLGGSSIGSSGWNFYKGHFYNLFVQNDIFRDDAKTMRYPWTTNISRFAHDVPGAYLAIFNTNGTTYGCTTWVSDNGMKDNVRDFKDDALAKINKIQHKKFDWKDGHRDNETGYVAQQLSEIDPEFAFSIKQEDGSSVMAPDITKLIPAMTRSIQQLSEKISALEIEIELLKELKKVGK